jgi:hypothetical protein
MKYAVEMDSGVTICIPSFIKIVSGIQKLRRHRQHGDLISLLIIFQNKESRLKIRLIHKKCRIVERRKIVKKGPELPERGEIRNDREED